MIYGIDLGTTNSLIGYDGQLYSGLVKSSVDLETNEQCDDLTKSGSFCSYKKTMSAGIAGRKAVKASSIILKKLVDDANKLLNQDVRDICVSVPAAFTPYQRSAVYLAAESVGLNVRGIIDEPTAACISAGSNEKGVYLVIDIGGGTSDFSIVDNTSGVYRVKSKNGEMVGGDDIDMYLVDKLMDFLDIATIDRTKQNIYAIKSEVERYKCIITEGNKYTLELSKYGFQDVTLDYNDLVDAVENALGCTIDAIINTLSDANVNNSDLKVVFVGGSCKGKAVTDFYKEHITLNFIELEGLDKDKAVAIGASKFAKMVEDGLINKVIKPISHRISVGSADGDTIEIIKLGSQLPTSGVYPVVNSEDTDVIDIDIYSGDSIRACNCQLEGTVKCKLNRIYKAGEGVFELTLELDEYNCMKVILENTISGQTYENILNLR